MGLRFLFPLNQVKHPSKDPKTVYAACQKEWENSIFLLSGQGWSVRIRNVFIAVEILINER